MPTEVTTAEFAVDDLQEILHRLDERYWEFDAACAELDKAAENIHTVFDDVRELQQRLVFGEVHET